MTSAEAIEKLKEIRRDADYDFTGEHDIALDLAIEVLERDANFWSKDGTFQQNQEFYGKLFNDYKAKLREKIEAMSTMPSPNFGIANGAVVKKAILNLLDTI